MTTVVVSDMLPISVVGSVQDFLWGRLVDHKRKFVPVLNNVRESGLLLLYTLRSVSVQSRNGIRYGGLQSYFICPVCGEKSMCPYTSSVGCCEDCEDYMLLLLP